ncbi:MAG TPA: hypothetical protein VMG60_19430 [Burkholderiaceae bacterium]|nr:hypothetical protein [Burkholderiaceae bacterium]
MARRRIALPRLAAEPDLQLLRWGWIAWGVLTIFLALGWIVFGALTRNALPWISVAPMLALWVLWPLYRGAGALWRWMRAAPHAAWNGDYYEFDGRQVRLLFDDDHVYVVAADVFAALDLRGHATEAARVRLIAGADGLRQLPGRSELVFSERGLNAWLDRRSGQSAVRFHRWLERDVIAPHRRRRELRSGSIANRS